MVLKTVVLCDQCFKRGTESLGKAIPVSFDGEKGEFHLCRECKEEFRKIFLLHGGKREELDPSPEQFDQLLEQSSLGSPQVKAISALSSPPVIPEPRKEVVPPKSKGQRFHALIIEALDARDWSIPQLAATRKASRATLDNWKKGAGSPSRDTAIAITEFLDLPRDKVFQITGFKVPEKKPLPKPREKGEGKKKEDYPYGSFYDYIEKLVSEKGHGTVEDFARKSSLALSTLERLKVKLPRGVTLKILSEYLQVPIMEMVKVYTYLKNYGIEESEPLDLTPQAGEIKARCLTCAPNTLHDTRNRSTHARKRHGKDMWDVKWRLEGLSGDPHICYECELPYQSRYALEDHQRRHGHRIDPD